MVARVVDADDDDRLDAAGGDQLLSGFVDAPFVAERRRLVEDVLPVVEVEHGISVGGRRIVVGRKIDDHRAVVLEISGVEVLVRADVAREGVGALVVLFDGDVFFLVGVRFGHRCMDGSLASANVGPGRQPEAIAGARVRHWASGNGLEGVHERFLAENAGPSHGFPLEVETEWRPVMCT